MSARRIKKSWWTDFRFNGIRYRKKSPDNSKAGAQAYEAVLRQKLARGEDIKPPAVKALESPLFTDFARQWLETYVTNNNKPSEIRQKRLILKNHLLPFFGNSRICNISSQLIEAYKAHKLREGKVTLKTVNNQLAVLSKCLRTAEEWELLPKAPRIKLFQTPPQSFDHLSLEESKQLLAAAEDAWKEMILVSLKTGVRFGELIALDWGDINFPAQTLTVQRSIVRGHLGSPKNNKNRIIPLTNEVVRMLRSRAKPTGFIFRDENGDPFKPCRSGRQLHRICEAAKLRPIGWHTLRHTFASHLAQAGAPMKAIQELLGHSDLKMTMRYAHLSPAALQDAVNLLEPKAPLQDFGHHSVNHPPTLPALKVLQISENEKYSLE